VLANMGQMSIYRNAGFNGNGLINLIDQPPSLGGGGGGGVQVITRMAGSGGAAPGATPTPEQKAESDRLQVLAQKRDFARLALGLLGSSFAAYPLEFSYAGEAEAADGRAFVVDVKGADDFTARLFVDARTNLPLMLSWMALEPLVMQQTVNRGGGSAEDRAKLMEEMAARQKEAEANRKMVEHRVHYSNFRTVNGLKMPHTLQRSIAGKPTEEMTFETIKINPKIDATKFEVTK